MCYALVLIALGQGKSWAEVMAADAIPGNDNVVFVRARHPGNFEIRCAELCGLWHGHMHNTGSVMTQTAFSTWITQQEALNAPATKVLPPYALHYFPDPLRRAG